MTPKEMSIQNVIAVFPEQEVVMSLEHAVWRYGRKWVVKELFSLMEHVETLTTERDRRATSSSSPRRTPKK